MDEIKQNHNHYRVRIEFFCWRLFLSIKSTLVVLLCLISIGSVCAVQAHDGALLEDGKPIGFTIEPSFGYLAGKATEIVYYKSTEDYLSELIWDLKNIFYTGGSVSLNISNRFYFNSELWFAVNAGDGFMDDFDWIYYDDNGDPTDYARNNDHERTGWTNWSNSSVEVVDSILFDINLTFDFLKQKTSKLSAIAGLKFTRWEWTDIVLDSLYPASWPPPDDGVNGIDYKLLMVIPYFGVGGGYRGRRFIADGRITYSPFLYAYDHDHHILNYVQYEDFLFFGQYIAFSLKSGYRFTSFFH